MPPIQSLGEKKTAIGDPRSEFRDPGFTHHPSLHAPRIPLGMNWDEFSREQKLLGRIKDRVGAPSSKSQKRSPGSIADVPARLVDALR